MTETNLYTPLRRYYVSFKLTNYCTLECAHCMDKSGPSEPKIFLPFEHIKYYIDSFLNDAGFDKSIVLTGGEPMSAFKHFDTKYIPKIIQYCMDSGIELDIKTNANWTLDTEIAPIVWKSLENLDFKTGKNGNTLIQFSLSMDSLHNNIRGNQELIKYIVNSPILKNKIDINTASIGKYDNLPKTINNEFLNSISAKKVHIKANEYKIKDPCVFIESEKIRNLYEILQFGRALDNNIGIKTCLDEFKFLRNARLCIEFHQNNLVRMTQSFKPNMMIPSIDNNGKLKPWNVLYPELVNTIISEYERNNVALTLDGFSRYGILKALGQER